MKLMSSLNSVLQNLMTAAGEWSWNCQVNSISKRTMKTFYVSGMLALDHFQYQLQWGLQWVCNVGLQKCWLF
jgi:hypothetical protein